MFRVKQLCGGCIIMNIALYQNNSDYRCVNKELSNEKSVDGVYLLETTDIVTPSFIILRTDDTLFSVYNYVSAPSFNRFYFIKGIKLLDAERIQIDCEVDVLMSFKSDIMEMEIIPDRSAINYNVLIPDSKVKNSTMKTQLIRKMNNSEFFDLVSSENISTSIITMGG